MLNELVESSGAVIVGGRTYHTAIEDAWDNQSPFNVPAFVLCTTPLSVIKEGFIFVQDGIYSALEQAKIVAGDKNVWVMGGADTYQQFIRAGLIDQVQVHIAPPLFKEGRRLFDHIGTEITSLKIIGSIESGGMIHVKYKIPGE